MTRADKEAKTGVGIGRARHLGIYGDNKPRLGVIAHKVITVLVVRT